MRRRIALAVGAVVLFGLIVTGLLVWPRADDPLRRADAVALLSGGAGDRLPKALSLVRDGLAPCS